jgi:hypothetical protein
MAWSKRPYGRAPYSAEVAKPASGGPPLVTVAPGAGAALATGYAPTVLTGAVSAPGAGSGLATGFAPTLAFASAVLPGAGSGIATGYAPTLTFAEVTLPGAGAALATGFAPSLAYSFALTPGTGAALATGFAPTATTGSTVAPGAGSALATGFAPSLGGALSAAPGTGSGLATGFAPTLTFADVVLPGTGAGLATGFAPTLGEAVAPGSGMGLAIGFAPTLDLGYLDVATGTGSAVAKGFAPSLLIVPVQPFSIVGSFITSLRANAPVFGGRVAGAAEFYKGLRDYNTSMPLPAAYVLPLSQEADRNQILNGLVQVVHKGIGIAVELDAQTDRRGQAPVMNFEAIEAQIFASCLNLHLSECRMSQGTYFLGAHYLDLDRARLFYQWEFGMDWQITDEDGVQPLTVPLDALELDIFHRPQTGDEPAAVAVVATGDDPPPPPTDGPWPNPPPYE